MTQAVPVPRRAAARFGRRRAPAGRLRLALGTLLLLVSALCFVAGAGLLLLRRELRSRDGEDTRPCPTCHSPAILDGRALIDEQGQRLLFLTPEDAARYAADYAKARAP